MPGLRLGLGLGLQPRAVVSAGGGGTAPANTVLPAITGTPTSGQTLSVTDGTWTGDAPITYAYQWKADGSAISGATGSTYKLTDSEVGAAITCTMTATNAAGSASATSAATDAVTAATPSLSVTLADTSHVANQASPTFTGLNAGEEAADRLLFAFLTYNGGGSTTAYSGCTIGGVSATQITAINSAGRGCSLYVAAVPTGATVDVNVTFTNPSAAVDHTVSLLRATGMSSTASDSAVSNTTSAASKTIALDCPSGGAIIAGALNISASAKSCTWTNVDELSDFFVTSDVQNNSTGARVYDTAQTGLDITAAYSASAAVFLLGASFAAA